MKADDLEQRIQGQRLKPIPAEWREPILAAAHEAARAAGTANEGGSVRGWRALLTALNSQLAGYLWPCPKAWAGLAAVWVAILMFRWTGSEAGSVMTAQDQAPPSPAMLQLVKEQQQLLAQLTGNLGSPAAEPAPAYRPKPKSVRQLSWSFA